MSDQPTPSVPNSSARPTVPDTSRVIRTYAQDMAAMQGSVTPTVPQRTPTQAPFAPAAPTISTSSVSQTPSSVPAMVMPQAPVDVSKQTLREKLPAKEKIQPRAPLSSATTRTTSKKSKGGALARFFSALVGSSSKRTTTLENTYGPMAGSSLIPDMTPIKMVPAAIAPTVPDTSTIQTPVPTMRTSISTPTTPTPFIPKTPTVAPTVPASPPTVSAPTPTLPTAAPAPAQQNPYASIPKSIVPELSPLTVPAAAIPTVSAFSKIQTPSATPPVSAMVMPQAPPSLLTPEQPVPSDGAPIPLRTTVPAPTAIAESREQLLARLHAKVAEHGEANERLVEDSVLPQSAPTTPELVPINNPVAVPSAETLSPLHTYKSDFSEHINDTHASGIEILAAQQDAAHSEPATPAPVHNPYAIWFAIGGVIFLITSMVGLLYAYRYNTHLSAPVVTRQTAPTLVFVDSQKELSGTGITLQKALAQEATQSLAQGSMRLTYISVATTTILGATTTVPGAGGYLIAALGIPIPDILMRNISLGSTVGVIHAGTQEAPFFVMHVASYDATFAGMLRWEKTMKRDLAVLYPPYPSIAQTNTATSTAFASSTLGVASSTVIATPVFTKAPVFVDKIIKNHDVRVLDDSAGRSLLLYGFWNKHTVIIARNAAAFIEIINRLNNSNTQ